MLFFKHILYSQEFSGGNAGMDNFVSNLNFRRLRGSRITGVLGVVTVVGIDGRAN